MKKIFVLLMTILLIISLVACSAAPSLTDEEILAKAEEILEQQNIDKEVPSSPSVDEDDTPSDVEIVEPEEPEIVEPVVADAKLEVTVEKSVFNIWKPTSKHIEIHVACEIKNTGNVPVEVRSVTFGLIDVDGGVVDTLETNLPIPEIIMPGEIAYACETNYLDTENVASIDVMVSTREADETQELLSFENVKYYKPADKYDDPKVTGYIINSTSETADDIRIAFGLYDAEDNLLGVLSQSQDIMLEPGEQGAFSVSYPDIGDRTVCDKVVDVKGKSFNWGF